MGKRFALLSDEFREELIENRRRLRRSGWNGKGMFIVWQAGYPDGIPINQNTAQAAGLAEGTVCVFSPYVTMRAADGSFVPWNASQADLLATDWEIADGE